MTETQVLLGKIAALRQRLEQAQGLVREAGEAAATLVSDGFDSQMQALRKRAHAGADHDALLDRALRPVTGPDAAMPAQLTSRARRVLERGRNLLGRLRDLADAFDPADVLDRSDPLAVLYRETASMTDTTLRMVPLFPQAAGAQLHLSEGMEAVLAVIGQRVATLTAGVQKRRGEAERVGHLAGLLTDLAAARPVRAQAFVPLAEELLAEARAGVPLRFVEENAADAARFVAGHCLTVARVTARVARTDADLKNRPLEPVLAALVHDVGMLRVPPEVLGHDGPLDDGQRRAVESHCLHGADLVAKLLPGATWLVEAARSHHERLDGSGYPDGLREFQVSAMTRLLMVCDVYAALCASRPHRQAQETRRALTDTLLMAEQGQLDRTAAERLLALTFYPVGQAVELDDGSVGVVVATPNGRREAAQPARPVVALLTDPRRQPLASPCHLDLAQDEGYSIVRTLTGPERREALGPRLAEWAC